MNREDQLATYRERITTLYPDLAISDLKLNDSGQNNDVVIADERFVFRFPRHASGIDVVEREVRLLRALAGRLPIPIPEPSFIGFQLREVGAVFMGYGSLAGEELQREWLAGENRLRVLAAQLGPFLRALHRVPLDIRPSQGATGDWIAGWEDMYRRIRKHLFPRMRPDAREQVTRHFEEFLGDERNRSVSPVLIHGDFGSGNILLHPASTTVTGIIDWGSAHVDDPAVDIAAVSTIAEGLVEELVPFYPGMAEMLPRVHFYRGTFRLQEGLFGAENDDEEALRAGLRGYT